MDLSIPAAVRLIWSPTKRFHIAFFAVRKGWWTEDDCPVWLCIRAVRDPESPQAKGVCFVFLWFALYLIYVKKRHG